MGTSLVPRLQTRCVPPVGMRCAVPWWDNPWVWMSHPQGASSTAPGTGRALGICHHAELRKPGGLREAGWSLTLGHGQGRENQADAPGWARLPKPSLPSGFNGDESSPGLARHHGVGLRRSLWLPVSQGRTGRPLLRRVPGGFSGCSELCVPKAAGVAKQAHGVATDWGGYRLGWVCVGACCLLGGAAAASEHKAIERSREDAAAEQHAAAVVRAKK